MTTRTKPGKKKPKSAIELQNGGKTGPEHNFIIIWHRIYKLLKL